MGSIVKNGIYYGGASGCSNDVELTLAEYEALGDKVNNDNVNYFITDSDGGQNNALSGSVLSYNSDTDYFGINYNGTWKDILYAGLQSHYLYNKGDEIVEWSTTGYTTSTNATFVEGIENTGVTGV